MSPLLKTRSRSCVMVSELPVFQQRIVRHSPPLQRSFICSCRGELRCVALRQGFSSPVGDVSEADRGFLPSKTISCLSPWERWQTVRSDGEGNFEFRIPNSALRTRHLLLIVSYLLLFPGRLVAAGQLLCQERQSNQSALSATELLQLYIYPPLQKGKTRHLTDFAVRQTTAVNLSSQLNPSRVIK